MRQAIGIIFWLCVAAGAHATTLYETGFDNFEGRGFVAGGAPGALDSASWPAGGLSEGDGAFGGRFVSGDFARGLSAGGVTSGGVYAFSVGPGGAALGLQGTSSDMTPGFFELRIANETGARLTAIELAYRLYVRNNGGRAAGVAVSLEQANDLLVLDALSAVTPGPADAAPGWPGLDLLAPVAGLDVAPGALLSVRWTFDDRAGRSTRDEIGIDGLLVRALAVAESTTPPARVGEPASTALLALGALAAARGRRRRDASVRGPGTGPGRNYG